MAGASRRSRPARRRTRRTAPSLAHRTSHTTSTTRSAGPSGTALHLAVEHGRSLAVIEQLLAAGADVERTRPDGRSAYALAIRLGRDELAEKLRASGASIEVAPTDRLLAALLARDEATARQLLGRDPSLRARVGADELDVVIDRVEAGDPDLAHRFVGLGFDPNQRGARQRRTLLHSAAILGDPALCAWLVTHRAAVDPTDHRGRTPLGLAVWAALATSSARHIATLDQLLQDGADPNELGTGWPLRIATYRRDLVLVDRLLRAGASPTLRARSGESAVSIARQLDLWELVGRFEGFPNSTSGPNDPTETS